MITKGDLDDKTINDQKCCFMEDNQTKNNKEYVLKLGLLLLPPAGQAPLRLPGIFPLQIQYSIRIYSIFKMYIIYSILPLQYSPDQS